MARRATRREFLKQGVIAGSALSFPLLRPRSGSAAASLQVPPSAAKKFASALKGRLILPQDAAYDSARRAWDGSVAGNPAMVVRCAGVEDIVRAVDFARSNELLLAVHSGGHSSLANSLTNGGIVIDLSALKQIRIDPQRRITRVQTGVTAGELDRTTAAYGMATVLGECTSVGVSGLTLGGGIGRLMGTHGASVTIWFRPNW
jgi:FAD/FMN-containing dehydrogenase